MAGHDFGGPVSPLPRQVNGKIDARLIARRPNIEPDRRQAIPRRSIVGPGDSWSGPRIRAHRAAIPSRASASSTRKTVTRNETRTIGSGVASEALNAIDMARPVVTTAQLVVASRRVRQILLRYI
jgi:hypothetical protein